MIPVENSAEIRQRVVDLAPVNAALRSRGIKGRLIAHDGKLYLRGTYSTADGTRKDRRVRLDLHAQPSQLLEAERRVIELSAAVAEKGMLPEPLPWASDARKSPDSVQTSFTVAAAITKLEEDFWLGKVRTSAAERTWDRLNCELKRLPQGATLTTDLLLAVASTTTPGSRSRVEACKTFKRLGKVAGIKDVEKLDSIRTPYEPRERELPSDAELLILLERTAGHQKYGWLTWALVTYGCRPAEACSLLPADNGTARVLTVKRKGKMPSWRTALALPVGELEEPARSVPWDVDAPSKYDSEKARRLVQAWGHWLKSNAPGVALYDCRHAWAVRSVRKMINASLAAKCLGHSLAVHHATYHRWLEETDVAAVAAQISTVKH
jgi:integrase